MPGGGGAAALVGALGVALNSMVANFSIGKKKFKALDENVQSTYHEKLKIFERNKTEFLKFVDLDTDAFNTLMSAFKLPKETDEEKKSLEILEISRNVLPEKLNLIGKTIETNKSAVLDEKRSTFYNAFIESEFK